MTNTQQDSADEARSWIESNLQVVEEAYQRFPRSGDWPSVGDLQRHFDRVGASIEVRDVIDSKPRVLNEARLLQPSASLSSFATSFGWRAPVRL
jgi:hypothetical protein